MHEPLRFRWLWLGVGCAVVGAVIYLSLTPSPPRPLPFNVWDKAEHFSAYLLLTAWFLQIYREGWARLAVALIFISLGAGLEVLQGMGGIRHFEFADMLANTLGAFTAVVLVRGRLANILSNVEKRLGRSAH